jgi:hypothetical protein
MAKININGVEYEGSRLTINNGRVVIDGKGVGDVNEKVINISVVGDVQTLKCDAANTIQIQGAVLGSVQTMSGDITCGDIGGNARSMSGDITADNIGGTAGTMSGDIIEGVTHECAPMSPADIARAQDEMNKRQSALADVAASMVSAEDSVPCVSCQKPSDTSTDDDASMCWQCHSEFMSAGWGNMMHGREEDVIVPKVLSNEIITDAYALISDLTVGEQEIREAQEFHAAVVQAVINSRVE